MLIAVVSGKGSPGASTTALALTLAWPRPVLLAECDPRGGDVLLGFGQGRTVEGRGLLNLHVAARRKPMALALWDQVIALEEKDTWVLTGLDEPRQAGTIDWSALARVLSAQTGVDVIADCGSAHSVKAPSPIWTTADLVVLVTGSSMRSVHAAEGAGQQLRAEMMSSGFGAERLVSVVVGPGRPYPLGDVSKYFTSIAPVSGAVDWDPAAAAVLTEGKQAGRRLNRAALLRSATKLTGVLGGEALTHRERASAAASEASRRLPMNTGIPASPQPQAPVTHANGAVR